MNPGLVMRCIIPVVMAGVLGIYGLIVAVIIQGASKLYIFMQYISYIIYVNEFESYFIMLLIFCCLFISIFKICTTPRINNILSSLFYLSHPTICRWNYQILFFHWICSSFCWSMLRS